MGDQGINCLFHAESYFQAPIIFSYLTKKASLMLSELLDQKYIIYY